MKLEQNQIRKSANQVKASIELVRSLFLLAIHLIMITTSRKRKNKYLKQANLIKIEKKAL